MSGAKRSRGKRASGEEKPVASPQFQEDVLATVLAFLPLRERVRASEVCRAWREVTLSPALWARVKLTLPHDDDEARAEAFLGWLLARTGAVESMHVDIRTLAQAPATEAVVGVIQNVTAALMAVAATLRHLTFETAGCLVVGQWAAALTQLTSACFIGGDVHLKQGLGKLRRLTDLEFGSNAAELEIESPCCLPPSVTHLSLEHCQLAALPPSISRLTQLRSLDLSQNTFSGDEGGGLAPLSQLTGLECLKLANCRLTWVPAELAALRKLRILHMGGNLEVDGEPAGDPQALEAALRPLKSLQVLVMSQCNVEMPEAVRRMPKLERLFVTSTPVRQLEPGPYCKALRHICVDWDVAFDSLPMLQHCTRMEMLTLARPHRLEQPDSQSDGEAAELAAALLRHPTLKQVNIVAVLGRGLHLSHPTFRFVVELARAAPRLRVELVDSWDSDLVRIPNLVDFDG